MIHPEKENCCGCGACAVGCPAHAIAMKPDAEGFLYPIVNSEKCINCSKCDKLCAFNKMTGANSSLKCLVARHVKDDVCNESTSGGMFTAISDVFLKQDGVVYCPKFDDKMYLLHQRICDSLERDASRGSKYVQSDLYESLESLLADLKKSKETAFFGTPCQVAAVKAFIPEKFQKTLYTIDIVCNGVGSPMFWERHKTKLEKKYKDKLSNYVFRPKKRGYLTQTEVAVFDRIGEKEIAYGMDRYNLIYYSGLIMRQCCSNCKFCSTNRMSDITISDYSKDERRNLPFETENGVSALMINTTKGNYLLQEFENDILCLKVPKEKIEQVRLVKCGKRNPASEEFLDSCRKNGIDIALKEQYGFIKRVKMKIKEVYIRRFL